MSTMRTVTKKHEEEGHISRLRNMLRPMSLSSFFAPLTSVKTTGCSVVHPLGKTSELALKPEGADPGDGVQNGWENPPEMFCPAKVLHEMFSNTVRQILYTKCCKEKY